MELEMINSLDVDEVDVVLLTREVLTGNWVQVEKDLKDIRNIFKSKTLKVILETSVLKDPETIKKTAECALAAGADFLKTSTGKEGAVADVESVKILSGCIENHFPCVLPNKQKQNFLFQFS